MLADILKQNNVDTSGMRFDTSARTALAFVTLRADGEREFLFFRNPSADMLLQESELDRNLLKQVFWISLFYFMKCGLRTMVKFMILIIFDCRLEFSIMVPLVWLMSHVSQHILLLWALPKALVAFFLTIQIWDWRCGRLRRLLGKV